MSPTTWGFHTFLVLVIIENILRGKKCFEKIFPLTIQAPSYNLFNRLFECFSDQ